jgi:hypothetical protein
MSTPFKMNGFSGFGDSPLRDGKKTKGKLKTTIGEKLKNIKHPVTPPTEEEILKSKGTIKKGNMIHHGRWNRPETWKGIKETWGGKWKSLLKGKRPKFSNTK